jgi:hypothetical protein
MKIEITDFNVRLVDWEYKYKRSKKNNRVYKTKVRLKKPYLAVNHGIKVYYPCILGATYLDNNGNKWICVTKMNLTGYECQLKMAMIQPYSYYILPTSISLLQTQCGE